MNSIFQNITQALGWSMVHSIWQGTIVYGLLCLVYITWPKLSAKHKYALAFISQITVFMAFMATFVHYFDFSDSSYLPTGDIEITDPILPSMQIEPQDFLTKLQPFFPWFSSLYVIGLFIQLIVFSNSFAKLRYLRSRGLQETPAAWQETFRQICTKLEINFPVGFFLSDKVSVPLTLGHFKPIILFPLAFVNNLDLKQTESILIHELAHIQRRDYLFNLLKVVMETVLFFNPFIWLLSKHIETEREHACDDIVVKWIPSPIAYAQALMSVELLSSNPVRTDYAMAATGNQKFHLLHRIQRITKMEKNYINVKQHLIALALSTIALVSVAWINPQKNTGAAPTLNIQEVPMVDVPEIAPHEMTHPPAECDPVPADNKEALVDTITPPSVVKETNSLAELPELEKSALSVQKLFETEEWKENLAKIAANSKRIEEYYNSAEWKEHIAKIEANSKRIEDYYNSPQWKEQLAKIEQNARRVEDYYNSAEWKSHIAKIEDNAKRVENYYSSPEWKNKIAKIEENAKRVEEYYNSAEWKDHIAKIEDNAKRVEEYYNSPEWKEKVKKIEENAKRIADQYMSPAAKEAQGKANDNKLKENKR